DGRFNLSSPIADGNFFNQSGNFNIYSNLFVATNGENSPPIAVASGTDNFITGLDFTGIAPGSMGNYLVDLNDNQLRDPNDTGDADGGANRSLNSPNFLSGRRVEGGSIRLTGTFNSTPNNRVQITVNALSFYPSVDGSGRRDILLLPVNVTFEVTTDVNGNANINQLYTADQSLLLSLADEVTMTATLINQVPITSENRVTTMVDVLGDTSEFSLPAVVPKPQFDFDEDGKTDIAVYRAGATPTAESFWYILNSSDFTFRVVQFGIGEDKIVAGDYQGDGVMDFAVFRPSNGTWYHSRITGNPSTNFVGIRWGTSTDIPVVGDFDGDGANDAAVFRPSEGNWWIRRSIDGSAFVQNWGLTTDKLAPADYDGDGDTDIAVFRPSNGTWYISPCPGCTPRYAQFGLAGDVPTPGDYDGDGQADVALWRPSTGVWYLLRSTAGFGAVQWGVSTDKPLNGDFDADGKNDLAIWRPSTGDWWILKSSDGNLILVHWGQNGDIPATAFAGAP
ncbi:MAG: FG-GAP repeat domain-containing protein, partial [Blastocatellia bacterium]